jgi:hypothetical protein
MTLTETADYQQRVLGLVCSQHETEMEGKASVASVHDHDNALLATPVAQLVDAASS